MVDALIKLAVAATFGALVGVERQIHGRQAGFRTQLLVCLGSCLFTIVSLRVYEIYGTISDPGRIAAQIITGIGFLGAGAILKDGALVRGLTTAASLWIVSAIGMAVGFGEYYIAAAATVIVLLNLVVLKNVESWLVQDNYAAILIRTEGETEVDVSSMCKEFGVKILENKLRYLKAEKIIEQRVQLKYKDDAKLSAVYSHMKKIPNLMELQIL